MPQCALLDYIEQLPDPRQAKKCRHLFSEVVFMALCGILCGADDWNSIELYARTREEWFRRYLKLPGGIPSHDTFNRLFSLLNPTSFHDLFIHWVQHTLVKTELSGVIAFDVKTQRGSRSVTAPTSHTLYARFSGSSVSLDRASDYAVMFTTSGFTVQKYSCSS